MAHGATGRRKKKQTIVVPGLDHKGPNSENKSWRKANILGWGRMQGTLQTVSRTCQNTLEEMLSMTWGKTSEIG